jgi:hypothetical protein
VSTSNDSPRQRGQVFGYREAVAEVMAELAASNARRLEAERGARRSVLVARRGLAVAA